MHSFHRSRLRPDLEILYDLGMDFVLILDGRFVLGCLWLNLTDRGQYQIYDHYDSVRRLSDPTSHRRSPQVTVDVVLHGLR